MNDPVIPRLLPSTGDALADEWTARVYQVLRENNGTIQECLDCRHDDFEGLPDHLKERIRDFTMELLPDLILPASVPATAA